MPLKNNFTDYSLKVQWLFVEISTNNNLKSGTGLKKLMKKSVKYHWKIILPIIHLKFNDYLLKYSHWHLSDIWFSLQGISYISLKFQHSFQTVWGPLPQPRPSQLCWFFRQYFGVKIMYRCDHTVRCDELKLTLGNLFLCYLIGIFSRKSWK
jgi:hypothetical protein